MNNPNTQFESWRRLLEAQSCGDGNAIDSLVDTDAFRYSDPNRPGVESYADWKSAVGFWNNALKAHHYVREARADGDTLWTYNIQNGLHASTPLMGADPNGASTHVEYCALVRFDDCGKIVGIETIADNLNLLMQMGVVRPLLPTHHSDEKAVNYKADPVAEAVEGEHRASAARENQSLETAADSTDDGVKQRNLRAWTDLFGVLNAADFDTMDQFFDADAFRYKNVNRTDLGTYASWKVSPIAHYHAFGVQQYTRQAIAYGNNIWSYNVQDGKHVGEPWMGVPATGKSLHVEWFSITRFNAAGKIIEINSVADVLGMMTQVGVIEPVILTP